MGSPDRKFGRPPFQKLMCPVWEKRGMRKGEGRKGRGKRGKVIKAVPRKGASVALAYGLFVSFCSSVVRYKD